MAVRGMVPTETVNRRVRSSFAIILACYGGLMGRLLYVQTVKSGPLHAAAINDRTHLITIDAHRGSILDRDLRIIASSRYAGAVGFDPVVLVEESTSPTRKKVYEKRFKSTVNTAAGLLGVTPDSLSRTLLAYRDDYLKVIGGRQALNGGAATTVAAKREERRGLARFILLRDNISLDLAQKVRQAGLMSIGVQDASTRQYLTGADSAQIAGVLAGGVGEGVNGLERSQNKWLNGTPGKGLSETDRLGRSLPESRQVLKEARDGYDVVTTLSADIQHIVSQEAQDIYAKNHPKSVSIIVVDPETGDLLAMAGAPDYDPDQFLNDPAYRVQKINEQALNSPCLTHLFEPGSTMKALTIATALDQNVITAHQMFNCPGTIMVDHRTLTCEEHAGNRVHGWQNIDGILEHSCNIGAATIGMKMHADRLYSGLAKFGLFDRLDIQMPVVPKGRLSMLGAIPAGLSEKSKKAIQAERDRQLASMGRVARVSFGHSVAVTPLHMAMAYAALANGGKLMQPRLVSAIRDMDGHLVQSFPPKMIRQAVKPEAAAEVANGLRDVVTAGTGKVAAVPGYVVAGKTGTARLYGKAAHVGSFVGYLPAGTQSKPKAVIYVVVDQPESGGYHGADIAAPAFQRIAARIMPTLHAHGDDPNEAQYKAAHAKRKQQGLL